MINLEELMTEALADVLQIDARSIPHSATFAECGLDSLSGLRFARKIEEKLGTPVELEWLFDHPSITELAALLRDRIEPRLRDGQPQSVELDPSKGVPR
jgi:acyl carrier protein